MLYIKRSDGVYVSYEGMTQDQITTTLAEQGLKCEFIDKETYSAETIGVNHG